MKKLIFLTKVCLLALSLAVFGPSKSNAQGLGLITLTNYEGGPLFILGPYTNDPSGLTIVLQPANPGFNNTNSSSSIVLVAYTNDYAGSQIQIHTQPGLIITIPTNVVIFPPPTLIFSWEPFGMTTTTNRYRVSFQWQSTPRAKYLVQRSSDELHWTNYKTIIGTGNRISVGNYPTGRWIHYRVITDWSGLGLYPPGILTPPADGENPFPPFPASEGH